MPHQVKQFLIIALCLILSQSLFNPLFFTLFRVLLQCGVDVDSRDSDSWTPLHAAAHWGQEEVCTLLADNMCDMGAINNVVRGRLKTFPWH